MAQRKKKSESNLLEVQNAAKTMFANIRFQSVDNPIRTMLLTSAIPNEGKTTTLVFLGQAIATSGKTVLLVDCDMRRRSLANELGLHATKGLYSVLAGETELSEAVVPTQTKGMYFLDVEPSIPNPADILASNRMAELIDKMEDSYDYVVFDTPPVSTFVDAAVLSSRVDGTILVVRPNSAKRSELRAANEQLLAAGANIIGICTTFSERSGSEYYYSYYTKGGKRSHRSSHESNPETKPDVSASKKEETESAPLEPLPDISGPIAPRGMHARKPGHERESQTDGHPEAQRDGHPEAQSLQDSQAQQYSRTSSRYSGRRSSYRG